ncbi:MAG: thiamine phosphate synthase [Mariprofundaceae bacterium]
MLIAKACELPQLILITDRDRLPGERFFEVVKEALDGGVDAILVREKQLDSAKLLAFSSRLRGLTHQFGAKLIIHTQADIAKAINADGVHIASNMLNEIPAMRTWLDDDKMTISASCHNEIELGFAHRFGADFSFLSPVFPTQSHPDTPALGIDAFKQLANDSPLPIIALGGINSENRQQLKGFGIATLGTIFDANEPKQAAQNLKVR